MKPSIPRGTRDLLPAQSVRRTHIFDTARSVFQTYGYVPIETPAMENLETLMGKYGEEGDRLIFRILKRGESLQSALGKFKESGNALLAEEALRYDLTVPFARFVVQYQNEIVFPFRRYQIQSVWRADKPQKGRYREFFQCDVDVVGTDSLLCEVELIQIVNKVFGKLGVEGITIKLNNRKVLAGMAELAGRPDKLVDITVAIDKIEKIGIEQVEAELRQKGLEDNALTLLRPFLTLQGSNADKIKFLTEYAQRNTAITSLAKGLEELQYILSAMDKLDTSNVQLDFSLARGLNYYTGAIFEVVTSGFPSSICGGGRYDDLTGIFGMKGVSGVGISFGADRILDVMESRQLFPETVTETTQVLFANFGGKELDVCLKYADQLREAMIKTEVYPEADKIKKQFKYADDKSIPYVCLLGDSEMSKGVITLKEMASGNQSELAFQELLSKLRRHA